MNLNQQLLAIHLTQGIGIATESRLIEAMNSNLLPSIYPWPLDLLLQITHRVYHDRIRATYTTALQRASNFKGTILLILMIATHNVCEKYLNHHLCCFMKGN